MNPSDTAGVIVGGWEYVWVAYGTFWVFVGGYAASLFFRNREDR